MSGVVPLVARDVSRTLLTPSLFLLVWFYFQSCSTFIDPTSCPRHQRQYVINDNDNFDDVRTTFVEIFEKGEREMNSTTLNPSDEIIN